MIHFYFYFYFYYKISYKRAYMTKLNHRCNIRGTRCKIIWTIYIIKDNPDARNTNSPKPLNTVKRHGLNTHRKGYITNGDQLSPGEVPYKSPGPDTACKYSANLLSMGVSVGTR